MTSAMPDRPNRFRVDFEPLLDEVEVMKRLGVSRPTLRRLVASGDLRCVTVSYTHLTLPTKA